MNKTYFCFLTYDESKDGTKNGYRYALTKKSEWVDVTDSFERTYVSIGDFGGNITKGVECIIHDDKVYSMWKQYNNLDEKYCLILCIENITACENKSWG